MSENKDIISAKNTIKKEIKALEMLSDSIDENLVKALDLIEKSKGKLIITGMGKPGHISKKIAATLASTGTPSFFMHPAEASHGDLGMLTCDDIVLMISNSGETKELSDMTMYCKRYKIPLIAMTKNKDSSLGKASDILLLLPNVEEACPHGLAPTSSTTIMLAFGDVIAVALLERKGFSRTDYNQRHPGGKLGAIFQKVSDLMHKGNEIPLVHQEATMQEAMLEMTSKMLGCVGIVNKNNDLLGIITDGDLRRLISTQDLLSQKASELMVKSPKSITKDALAAEAVAIMNDKKIGQLFVIDDGKAVGVIHLHDCLRAGVA